MVKTLRQDHLDFCFYDSGSSNKGHLSELWRESGVEVRIQGREGRVVRGLLHGEADVGGSPVLDVVGGGGGQGMMS